ncbi:MAG: hypothetical protein Q9162_005840 [Coniocarpon cinnabarinum]
MADQPDGGVSPHLEEGTNAQTVRSAPHNRIRWATHKANPQQGRRKRQSILDRFHHRRTPSDKSAQSAVTDNEPSENGDADGEATGRTIHVNQPLPPEAKDEDGRPVAHYARNKIRTAKYTPLSFVPKNLWFQFHNVANIYFLFIVLLSIEPIFGVQNPALNSVPLIVIVTITAIKDAIEDFRRTVLDNELNNSGVHRLVDWENVNAAGDKISLWRRFKKANTRGIVTLWTWMKHHQNKTQRQKNALDAYADRAMDNANSRPNMAQRDSQYLDRPSFQSDERGDDVEMTPVPSPRRSKDLSGGAMSPPPAYTQSSLQVPGQDFAPQPQKRDFGDLINYSKTTPEKARFNKDAWKNIQVGDYIRLFNGDPVPADMVVLSTSDPDGACYIETKELDGETNLKVRQSLRCGRKMKRARDCEKAEFTIQSEGPQANLYSYNGVIKWNQTNKRDPDKPTKRMAEPLSINNLLLRGCSLRNTEWVLGVVIFTGQETKIMLNSGVTPSKRAKISRDLNWNVCYNFIVLFFMCVVAGFVEGFFWDRSDTSSQWFEYGNYGSGDSAINGLITFWASIILFQNLVPISLYISLEIVRTFQAFFIYSDTHMYWEKLDFPCTPKSWNISDDLGQIEYVFSDKTGTLTQNVMEFKKATVAGEPYGEAYTEALAGMQKRQGIDVAKEGETARVQIEKDRVETLRLIRQQHDNPYLREDDLQMVAPNLVADIGGASGEYQAKATYDFMIALALCHSVITERTPGNPPRIEFKAQSPDEAALVATARDYGFTVIGRTADGIILNIMGKEQEFTVLNTLEFNSTRKRMSSIIRMPDGKIVLFCKGADSIIYSRLYAGEQQEMRKATAAHLEEFAREGLRTLCVASKVIPEDLYQQWNVRHDAAAAAVEHREDKLEEVADEIERDLTLLGGTAIEDQLQGGVPDSIALLGTAGIKLWVLTGDKVETAINIGFSCNLLNNDMDLIMLQIEDGNLATAEAELDKNLRTFNMVGSEAELQAARQDHGAPDPTHAIIVDGESLKLVLDESIKRKFLLLCKQCQSVLCCRVSPAQKAAVVGLVKNGLNVITLAVGDGANDVAMIQQADVGVGIAGEEGRQAVMSSDFAIGQFRFLTRLLLVHGRWNYRRMAETISNFFYKNIVWAFSLFWYQIYDNYDGGYVFDYSYVILFNLAFTSLTVIFLGILDQDVSDKVSLAVPQLYRRGIEQKEWTQWKFWVYMFDGLYQSIICLFMTELLFAPGTFNTKNGLSVNDQTRLGVFIGCGAVASINAYIVMNVYRWDWATLGIALISVLLIFFWTGVYTSFTVAYVFYHAASEIFATLAFWALFFVMIVICLLPRFFAKAIQKIYFPLDVDIIREQVRLGKFDYLEGTDPSSASDIINKMNQHASSSSSSEASDPKAGMNGIRKMSEAARSEAERPIYPPSVAGTATTGNRNPHSQQGSDDSTFPPPISMRLSQDQPRGSFDRPRPSYDRMRSSLDQLRPSFERSRDMTSAAQLAKVESSNAHPPSKLR